MPGRQAHGRPLTAKPTVRPQGPVKKSKSKLEAHALDAYAIAAKQFPEAQKRTPRFRQLRAAEEEASRKHGRNRRDENEDEDGDEDNAEEPQRKRVKPSRRRAGEDGDDDVEYGSDSDGNEWKVNGEIDDDEDEEIDSDEAFGESDEERFEGYTFGGSKSKGDEGDLDDDDLGDDAIDLAQALDQSDDESLGEDDASASGSDDESTATSSDEEDEEDDDMVDPEKVGALQSLVTKYAEDGKKDNAPKQRQKIDLSDLGLSAVNDPQIRKSVKIMSKEDREVRPGTIKKKLEVPLARRQQDKVLRSAAYDKTNETLDRWTETVKLNRRAEHLVFPLPQNLPGAGLDNSEIRPLTEKNASNELESTIMSIMEQSGLLVKPDDAKKGSNGDDEEAQGLSKLELQSLWSERRRERELNSRETQRAKRIKKIKSKAYHRVHRKARQKEEIKLREAMEEAGEIDSEEEREAQDRKRALERVGARHRDSKWAKSGSKMKRAVWDDDFRTGVHEMAQKNEDLRRRKEGRAGVSGSEDEDDDDESSGSESDNDRLLQQLDKVADADDGAPQSKLMQLKFMQRAEEALKKFNDDAIDQIRRDLGSDPEDEGSEEEVDIGRRSFGMAKAGAKTAALFGGGANREGARSGRRDVVTNEAEQALTDGAASGGAKKGARIGLSSSSADATADPTAGAWSKGEVRRKSKKGSSANAKNEALDLNADILVAEQPRSAKSRAQQPSEAAHPAEDDAGSEDEAELHLPLAIRDRELVARAFAGEDVVGDFAAEKAIVAEADDDKIVDETLPGWGSWVGDGLSAREQAKNKGRWLKTVQGVKKKDRKDAKLDKVIINEKTVKKNSRYLASQLPHPFESKAQYERSLRLPVGQEWQTKETFTDATKPRIIVKQGIITPIAKPVL